MTPCGKWLWSSNWFRQQEVLKWERSLHLGANRGNFQRRAKIRTEFRTVKFTKEDKQHYAQSDVGRSFGNTESRASQSSSDRGF